MMADKYINRDTAINEAICAVYWALNQHGNVNGQVIIDKFNAIPSVDIPQWISVEERLPEENKPVVATYWHENKRYSLIMLLDEFAWFRPTHWFYLPEPPKEET